MNYDLLQSSLKVADSWDRGGDVKGKLHLWGGGGGLTD